MEPFLLPLRSYSAGCCIQRVGLNRARHAQSLLEASKEIAKGNRHASAWNKISGTFYMFNQLSLSSYTTGCSQPWPCKPPSELRYTPAAQPEFCHQNTTFTFRTKVHTLQLSFLAVFHKSRQSTSCQLTVRGKPSCTKILLTFCIRRATIALNYSFTNIRNDVHQIKFPFDSLVWGSLTLAPNKLLIFQFLFLDDLGDPVVTLTVFIHFVDVHSHTCINCNLPQV